VPEKNWPRIAECDNEQLQSVLIHAKGEVADGLERGFPQYFLAEGEQQERLSKEVFLKLVRQKLWRRDDVVALCKDLGVPCQKLNISGTCKGDINGPPYSSHGYFTAKKGFGQYFYRSTKKIGGEVEYEGATWIVVRNHFSPESKYTYATHTFAIVPAEALSQSG
jgi:hypothetical protein